MRLLKESILDNDFDIKGVEMYEYDWLSWPCMQGTGNAGVIGIIKHFNAHQYIEPLLEKFKAVAMPTINEIDNMEAKGYCANTQGSIFRDFRNFLISCHNSLQFMEKELQRFRGLSKEQIQIIEIVNDIFGNSKLKNIGPKWNERYFYLGYIDNNFCGPRLTMSNYGDKKEYDLMCDIVAKVCKKRNLEYKTEYGVDSDDEYQIRIYLK